jgi:thiol:disulfide interchange protein DsbD
MPSSSFLARLLIGVVVCFALIQGSHPARADEEFLAPEAAFRFSAHMLNPHAIDVRYDIADGYHMYRERFKFTATHAKLGKPIYQPGTVEFDETFGKNVETYRHSVEIRIPVEGSGPFTLQASGQGCADKGLCYPPQEATVQLTAGAMQTDALAETNRSDLSGISTLLQGGRLLAIVPAFVLLGLGLAFTPCVLPMVPILSSIIVGEGAGVKRARGFLLSLAYSLGMAIVYTLLGVAAGLAGEGLAAALQNAWVLSSFALLIAAMALSMFDVYQLQMPAALQSRLTVASARRSPGKLAGVFAMGAISALIVGPCVAAPLAGALVYISQTRDVLIGGVALFAMALGMSIPLLLVGVSAGSLLPRAGRWMKSVKRFFGVLMLAMALWMVAPVLPGAVQMLLWAGLLLGYGAYLMRGSRHWAALALGAACAVLGTVQLVGLSSGGRDPLAPLAHLRAGTPAPALAFKRIKSVADLDAALAANGQRKALLDFYADWCVACKEMERQTFVDPAVRARLRDTLLLQVDVTANNTDDRALLKRFGLFGPPGIILFNHAGHEIPDSRVIGYQDSARFLTSLDRLE